MSQSVPYSNSQFDHTASLEKIPSTKINSDTGYVLEVELKYTEKAKKVRQKFPLCAENNQSPISD